MLFQLLIGSTVIAITIIVEGAFLGMAIKAMKVLAHRYGDLQKTWMMMSLVIGLAIWVVVAHSAAVWIWALVFVSLDAIDGLEPAVYFSLVAFTTLGFGDIVLEPEWRILSGLTAANGLVLFGLSTAILVDLLTYIRKTRPPLMQHRPDQPEGTHPS